MSFKNWWLKKLRHNLEMSENYLVYEEPVTIFKKINLKATAVE